MGRKIRRVKRFVKNSILGLVTVFAMLMWIASADALADSNVEALIIFVASTLWIVAFFKANNFFSKEEECRGKDTVKHS